ncbi:MAG: COX15/CtaA family protein, partial [Rhodoferax sp.]|nr:COX15/CtaA family protein [Rhodoferax sp.]
MNVPLYDLSPALTILALGLLLALLPVSWLLWRTSRGRGRLGPALSVLTLFLTLDLILFGAFTRLSDSGLGCPDWPGCYGQSNP